VKATRQHKLRKGGRGSTLLVTIGKPNYLERKFVRECQKAGEPFPIKRIQLKGYPAKKPPVKKK